MSNRRTGVVRIDLTGDDVTFTRYRWDGADLSGEIAQAIRTYHPSPRLRDALVRVLNRIGDRQHLYWRHNPDGWAVASASDFLKDS